MAARGFVAGALFLLAAVAWAELQPIPPFSGYVVDETGALDAAKRGALEQTLAAFAARKGSQIAVLIVPTAAPEAIEQYSLRVAEQWQLGRKGVDDGALLLVAKGDHALRIEVGYGLEGALTDADSKRIISEVIVPLFKHGDFYGGIAAGVERMIKVIEGEPLPPPDHSRFAPEGNLDSLLPFLFIFSFIAGGILRALFGPLGGATITGGLVGIITWLFLSAIGLALLAGVIAFLFTLIFGAPGRGGGWSSPGRYGGWSGGSLPGGGFRGGGGGRFGGGGASGRW
jgi:uncharacterized protein